MHWMTVCFEMSRPIRLKKSMIPFRHVDCSRKHMDIFKLPWTTVLFTDNEKQIELNKVYFYSHIGLIIYCLFIFVETVRKKKLIFKKRLVY